MAKIADLNALKILDSLGNWTLEARVSLEDGSEGTASVPTGVSAGRYEARSVLAETAVANIYRVIKEKVLAFEAADQRGVDRLLLNLDGTANKSHLGANTLLAVSEAVCLAAASSQKLPLYRYVDSLFEPRTVNFALPSPLFNVIEGGGHTHNELDFQEFLFIPGTGQPLHQKIELGAAFYRELKKLLLEKGLTVAVGDEGGFSPEGIDNREALELLAAVLFRLDLHKKQKASLGLDIAASQFCLDGLYRLKRRKESVSSRELTSLYASLVKDYPLTYLEDPLQEDDSGWEDLRGLFVGGLEIIGDDLTVTNAVRLKEVLARRGIIQGIIIKPNQVGTITETLQTVELAKKANLSLVVSHRAGETTSSFIADFAVGIGAKYIKFGAPARGERIAKYDRLLEIEKEVARNEGSDRRLAVN